MSWVTNDILLLWWDLWSSRPQDLSCSFSHCLLLSLPLALTASCYHCLSLPLAVPVHHCVSCCLCLLVSLCLLLAVSCLEWLDSQLRLIESGSNQSNCVNSFGIGSVALIGFHSDLRVCSLSWAGLCCAVLSELNWISFSNIQAKL